MVDLKKVKTGSKRIGDYKEFLSRKELRNLKQLGRSLFSKKILHVNSTPQGGGVAEILESLIPLLRSVSVDCDWYSISAPVRFFSVTKRIHNGLQGARVRISKKDLNYYLEVNRKIAEILARKKFDLAVVHDPQPLPIVNFCHLSPMISRVHLDLSTPNRKLLSFLLPYFGLYDDLVFSLKEFVPKKLLGERVSIIEPAIDPLAEKNLPLAREKADAILERVGIDPKRPVVVQVSRFDPWKDPVGVIRAYLMAKEKIPKLQLVLVGLSIEKDNPEARKIYKKAVSYAMGDPDIFLFFDPKEHNIANALLVRALQSAGDVILQKSIREGFGLTVAEAMWKGKVVIGGNAAGIKRQIEDGVNGFIVKTPKEAAEVMLLVLENPSRWYELGKKAKRNVKDQFLITRLVEDHLKLYIRALGL